MKYIVFFLLFMFGNMNAAFCQTNKESDYFSKSTDGNDGGDDEEEEDEEEGGGSASKEHVKKKHISPFHAGQVDISAGIGLIPLGYSGKPFSVSVDVAMSDAISIGGYFGSANAVVPIADLDNWYNIKTTSVRTTIIGVRFLYHFYLSDNLDSYAGSTIAYATATASVWDASSLFVGGRYRFGRNIGVFIEIGYGVSVFNTGLNFRL